MPLLLIMHRRGASGFVMLATGGMMLMQSLGAIGAAKFVALAGNTKHADCRKKDGE